MQRMAGSADSAILKIVDNLSLLVALLAPICILYILSFLSALFSARVTYLLFFLDFTSALEDISSRGDFNFFTVLGRSSESYSWTSARE